MQYFLAVALTAFCSFAWSDAEAATATGTFNVTVIIAKTCVLDSQTNLNFGTAGVLAAAINDTSTITVTCTNSTTYNIGLNAGLTGASVTTREMKGALGGIINYSLFRDAAMLLNWGQTVGTDTLAATGTGAAQPFMVFGQIPPQATPAPDTYTDTITVTVTF